ncbi:MAG: GAF domain-containing protein [Deltaproteobacteria bacterium]|nr:GAF domain-containing protein [Deltaproteobacteria bacterium]
MLFDKEYISVKFSRSKLKQRNRELSVLLEMSNFLASRIDQKSLLNGALSKVLEYFDLEAGRIYLMDEGGRYLYLSAHHGMEPHGLERVNIDEGFSGKSARTRSFIAQYVSELEDKKRATLLSDKGFRIIICVPLIIMDRVAGVMNLATSKTIELDQGNIDLLTAVGNQIAVAVNNVMLHEDQKNKIEALKEKTETIKFFAYTVSHDFKSPVTGIYGITRLLREKYGHILDEKGREYCDQIMKTAEHMVAVVEKLNAYIKTKEDLFNFERIKVKEVIETIRSQFATVFKKRRIRWSEPEILPEIVADKLALSSVFRNFVDNALKYGGDDLCEIKIGYKEDESFHIFSFSDDGIGMKAGDETEIFKVFKRNETSKGTSGSGLGLAIVTEIAKSHQGRVWVDTGTQKGMTFHISISKALEVTG